MFIWSRVDGVGLVSAKYFEHPGNASKSFFFKNGASIMFLFIFQLHWLP